MKEVAAKNGGTLNPREKGDPAPPGAGRPAGSISFKKLANQILDGKISREDAEGKKMLLTRKEAMVLSMVEDAINDEDPNTRLKAGFGIWDRLEKDPIDVNVNTVNNGGNAGPEQIAALKLLLKKDDSTDVSGLGG